MKLRRRDPGLVSLHDGPPKRRRLQPDISISAQTLLSLAHIEAHTPYQRELLGAYSRAVIELSRCVMELERADAPEQAATLARYASEVTDIACEHVAMSGEIHRVQQ